MHQRHCLFFVVLLVSSVAQAADRPNVLFAFADDWGRYASAYAAIEKGGLSDLVSTPNFDRIAKEGVLFTNAFVNAPSCTPCRSSLLSGQYFWRTGQGAILQGAHWDTEIPTYPTMLEKAGYHIGYSNKVWSPGDNPDAPFGGRKNRYNGKGSLENGFSQYLSRNSDDVEAAKGRLLDEVRGNFQDYIANREDGEPLCYWWGPTNCHRKWIQGSGKEFWGLDPEKLKGKVPAFLPDVPIVREDLADYLGEVQAFDAGLGVLLDELERMGELDNTMVIVSGDHGAPGFPNGKCNLYDFGTHVPLAIRLPGQVPPDRVVHDFVSLPDLTPTILELAGEQIPEVMTAKSLMPILQSDKSGVVDPLRDAAIVGRERHVAAARNDWMPYPQRAIRTKNFLYIRNFKPDRWPMGTGPGYGTAKTEMPKFETLRENTFAAFGDLDASPSKAWIVINCEDDAEQRKYFDYAFGQRPEEELYDLRSDFDQIYNVANESRYAEAKQDLSARLMQVLKDSGDPRVTGDGTTFDKPPFASPYKNPPRRKNSAKQKKK